MTREEAISLLTQVNHILVNSNSWLENTHEPLNMAFDMAIKALEQEPCDDAVSRQMAIDAITKIHPIDMEYDCTLYDKLDVMYVLKDLPPVTPQSKMGHWIRSWCEWQQYLECSKCGYETGLRCDTNYCPNCGAKMIESEE